jgi:hypothetical protein
MEAPLFLLTEGHCHQDLNGGRRDSYAYENDEKTTARKRFNIGGLANN